MKKPVALTEVVKLEKSIEQRWGAEAVSVPIWDNRKETEYLEQLKARAKVQEESDSTTLEHDGFLLNKKLVNTQNIRSCPICELYLFYGEDELYINKFGCCHLCYIRHVEGREEKWDERKRELLNEGHKKEAERADQRGSSEGREADPKAD